LWGTGAPTYSPPFEKCLGFSSYQITIRTTYEFRLRIVFSDSQQVLDGTTNNTGFEVVIPANSYKHYSVPVNGDQVRWEISTTGGANPTATDTINIRALLSLSPHYILT
tara:strand:+ start:243 stop:569 length:327 start_codon:yes stop_codon:yes gene_type:complete